MAALLVSAGMAQAQEPGRVNGIVRSSDGAPVEGARVVVLDAPIVAMTGADGRFSVALGMGRHAIEVRRIGFRPARRVVEPATDSESTIIVTLIAVPITVDAIVAEAIAAEGQRTHDLAALLRVPPVGTANVTTVTMEQIHAVHAANPWDLVRQTTGLEVHEQGQGPGFASDAVIRGFTSDHSGDVALVMDGIPINEPVNGHGEGYADWNLLFPGGIADAQVVKGPVSAVFGNFAAGGAVNVATPASARQTEVEVQGGSHAFGGATLTTGLERGPWGAFAAAHYARSDGWREHSDYDVTHFEARANRRLSPTLLVDGSVHWYGTSWDSPGFVSLADFEAGRLAQAADRTDGGTKRRLMGRLTALHAGERLSWQATAWGAVSRWHLFLNIPELGGVGEGAGGQTEELDDRQAAGARGLARYTVGAWEITGGAEFQRHAAAYDRYATTARARDSALERFDATFASLSGHLGAARTVGRWLRVEGALRYDAVRPRSTDRLAGTALPSAAHGVLGPKLGIVLAPRSGFQLYGSLARGFRSAPGTVQDPSLPPVVVWSYEAGLRRAGRHLDASLALFRLETRDERFFDPVTLETGSGGTSAREGIETELVWRPAARLVVETHWTVNTLATFALPPGAMHDEETGVRVPGVAAFVGRTGLRLTPAPALEFHGWVTATGPFTPLGEPDARTAVSTMAHVQVRWRAAERLDLVAGVANLFDARAPELRASGYVNPAAPRTFQASLSTRL